MNRSECLQQIANCNEVISQGEAKKQEYKALFDALIAVQSSLNSASINLKEGISGAKSNSDSGRVNQKMNELEGACDKIGSMETEILVITGEIMDFMSRIISKINQTTTLLEYYNNLLPTLEE